MEIDIGANNYPFQWFLCFLTFEITPKFSVNQNKSRKLYFEPQLFTQKKNVPYKETFDKMSFQNKVLHPNTGEMKLE